MAILARFMNSGLFKWANQPRFKQFVKFCFVGGSGVVLDMAALHLLVWQCNWDVSLAKLCAAEVAMLNNFLWNEVWTFRGTAGDKTSGVVARLLRFHLICGFGIGLAVLLLHLFYGRIGFHLFLANGIAIVLVTIWNFWMNAIFNWRNRTESASQSAPAAAKSSRVDAGLPSD